MYSLQNGLSPTSRVPASTQAEQRTRASNAHGHHVRDASSPRRRRGRVCAREEHRSDILPQPTFSFVASLSILIGSGKSIDRCACRTAMATNKYLRRRRYFLRRTALPSAYKRAAMAAVEEHLTELESRLHPPLLLPLSTLLRAHRRRPLRSSSFASTPFSPCH